MREQAAAGPRTWRWRLGAGLALALTLGSAPLVAQPTNADVLGRLAADCLADVAPPAFALVADVPPYLRTPLLARWRSEDARVFLDTTDAAVPRLHLGAPRASVRYARAPGRRYARTVHLKLPYTLVTPAGEVLRAGTCDDGFEDAVDRRRVAALEDPAHPETAGERPAPGWVRRYAEPLVLAGAVAVSTLLFFSLRSR